MLLVIVQYKKLVSRLDRRTLLANTNYRLNHATVVKLNHPILNFSVTFDDLIGESLLF